MKRRGRPSKKLEEVVKEGLLVNNIAETLVFNEPNGVCNPCS